MRGAWIKTLNKIKKLKPSAIIDGIHKILLIINLILSIFRKK